MNRNQRIAFIVLFASLLISAAIEVSWGPVQVPISRIIPDAMGYFQGGRSTNEVVIGAIRLPRLLMAALVGAGLASTGAVLQAIFRNPMADPSIIGVSSGGTLGAVLMIQFGVSQILQWSIPLGAFCSGLIVVFVIYRLATVKGRTGTYSLLLSGVAMSSLCSSIVTLLLSLAPLETMQQMLFWLMGGLDGSTWSQLAMVCVFVAGGFLVFLWQSNSLDIISIGEEHAEGVGVALQRTKQIALCTAALVVGACVSSTGVIGFVGLIVPHLLRLWIGPRHHLLIPASALGGALLLVLSDIVARTILYPVELNVGIITSCLGAPFFLFLLRRQESNVHGG
jgi:iron complex transport system permease protein